MQTSSMDRWISRYVRKLQFGEFLKRAADAGAVFLFAFGGLVLLVKLTMPQFWPHVLWLVVGCVPAAVLAWYWAGRQPWSRTQSIARLDKALNTGGLLMTLAELPDQHWRERLPQYEEDWQQAMPRLRPKRFASHIALPLLFAIGACFIPLRTITANPVIPNTVAAQATNSLEELMKDIEEKAVLEEEEKKQIEEEIKKLAEETKQNPLSHEKWETVDAMRERIQLRIEDASAVVMQTLSMSEALAALQNGDMEALTEEQVEQLEKKMGESLDKLMEKGAFKGAPDELRDQLQRLAKKSNGKMGLPKDPKERQEMLDSLKEFLNKEKKKLDEARGKCQSCKGEGQCESECDGNGNPRNGNGKPGRGGVSRGRGDAEMTWGDESDLEGVKFKETVLPKGFEEDPKDEIVGIRKNAPKEETVDSAPKSAARDSGPATGDATVKRNLSPRHRNVVQKYFNK